MNNLHIESLALYYDAATSWCYKVESDPDFYSFVPHYEATCYIALAAPRPTGIFESKALKNRERGWRDCRGIDGPTSPPPPPIKPIEDTPLAEKMFKFL